MRRAADVAPHHPPLRTLRTLGRRSRPRGLRSVCFFILGLSKGERRFRSESYALQIHGEVRGQGSGFQQHRISRVRCSVSPGSSGRLNGVRHVAFSRQTQVCGSSKHRPRCSGGGGSEFLVGICPILAQLFGSVGKLDPGSALDFYSFRSHE